MKDLKNFKKLMEITLALCFSASVIQAMYDMPPEFYEYMHQQNLSRNVTTVLVETVCFNDLIRAIRINNRDLTLRILDTAEKQGDIEGMLLAISDCGETALWLAAARDQVEVVREILNNYRPVWLCKDMLVAVDKIKRMRNEWSKEVVTIFGEQQQRIAKYLR